MATRPRDSGSRRAAVYVRKPSATPLTSKLASAICGGGGASLGAFLHSARLSAKAMIAMPRLVGVRSPNRA